MSEEINAVQENTPVEQDDSTVDYKNLYLSEVQNAKKLRKRAQDSEGSLQEIQKQRETERVKSLEEQGKYKEMYEDIAGKYEEAQSFKERYTTLINSQKEEYLAQLPEEQAEKLKDEKLKTIRLFVENFGKTNKASNPTHVAGVAKQPNVSNKSWADMDENEKRAFYAEATKGGGATLRK